LFHPAAASSKSDDDYSAKTLNLPNPASSGFIGKMEVPAQVRHYNSGFQRVRFAVIPFIICSVNLHLFEITMLVPKILIQVILDAGTT